MRRQRREDSAGRGVSVRYGDGDEDGAASNEQWELDYPDGDGDKPGEPACHAGAVGV